MGGLDAVVNLGAGFDTRLYRLPPASGVPAWEADLPENVATKRGRLRQLLGGVPPNVRLVAIDLEREKLGQILARHGYATGSRTLFIAEALTQYLHDQAIAELFGFLAEAATGSGLLFTYVLSSLIEGRAMYGQEALYQRYVAKRAIWLWGLDPEAVGSFLGGHGWRMLDHPDYAALAERYVRPTGRDLASTPIERIVYAQKV
jgi:methyltransferase (TIGR00027 family)